MGFLAQLAQSDVYERGSSMSSVDGATAAAIVGGMTILILFTLVAAYVISSFLLGRIFKKAGVEQWVAWVPFYNTWKMLELGGQQGFWAVLAIIPVVNVVAAIFTYIAMYNIGLKLQKEGWFVVLAIFLPIVWMIWLAFDSSVWREKGGAAPAKTPVKK